MNISPVIPLYSRVKEYVLAAIERGELLPGDQIPSQRELCEQFGISLMTARRAINELINEGVIYAIPGKGLYVAIPKQPAETSPLISFTDDMTQRGMKAVSQVLEKGLTPASQFFAHSLGVDLNTELAYLRRLRVADNRPIAIQSNYVVHKYCPGILQQPGLLEQGLFHTLRSVYGIRLAGSNTTVEAALASEEEAELLEMSQPAPLLVSEQVTLMDNGRAIEFARTAYRGDRYHMNFRGR